MEIPLSSQIEEDIMKSALAGDYVSVAKQLADAILSERPQITPSARNEPADQLRKKSWREFHSCRSVEDIANEQGIGPVGNSDDLQFPDWPEDESVDDFIAAAKGLNEPTAEI